jgi:hypothetical protein
MNSSLTFHIYIYISDLLLYILLDIFISIIRYIVSYKKNDLIPYKYYYNYIY